MKSVYFVSIVMSVCVLFAHAQDNQKLTPEVFAEKIKQTPEAVVLDVRTLKEFKQGHLAQARLVDYNGADFRTIVKDYDKSKPYFVYCLSGGRSGSAADYMRSLGFKEVYEMKGGLLKWTGPLEKPSSANTPDKISMSDYERMITSEPVVLVDFYAPWCGPCKKMEPMLEEFTAENQGKVKVIRINIDESIQLAHSLHVEEIPVIKIFKSGKETYSHTGLLEKQALTKAASLR
jgi:thioredoxin